MLDYPFEKSEYNYMAALLVFGAQSPYIEPFKAFSLDIFRKHKEMAFSEFSGLNVENRLEITRKVSLDKHREIETGNSEMSSEVNRIITYVDHQNKINISDTVFSEDEFKYFDYKWDDNVKSKIKNLGLLLKALQDRDMDIVPIFINEFPNIMKTLINYPEYWLKKDVPPASPKSI